MKLIRLTDDRYVLDGGEDIRPAQMDAIRAFWDEWWATELERPSVVVIAGHEHPLEYEDRRESDIEMRLQALEKHIHYLTYERDHPGWTGGPIQPRSEPET